MLYIDNKLGDNKHPNGSILFPFDKYYNTVLDANKKVNSDYYHIVKSNTGVESTVKPTEAKIGGGMSDPDKGAKTQSSDKSAEELPAAAKADEPAVTEQEATVASRLPHLQQSRHPHRSPLPRRHLSRSPHPQLRLPQILRPHRQEVSDAKAGDAPNDASPAFSLGLTNEGQSLIGY